MVRGEPCLPIPTPVVAFPWGSRSTRSVLFSARARPAARFTAVVVFPTPPFWFTIARVLATSVFHDAHYLIVTCLRFRECSTTNVLRSPRCFTSHTFHSLASSVKLSVNVGVRTGTAGQLGGAQTRKSIARDHRILGQAALRAADTLETAGSSRV